jgi:diaminohydroxyphosphoribosylaminopyrimidine deaminase/5-amino-6-(5-phosphoribosylamino)uracil reductase
MVGAVLVRDRRIVGEGFHTYDGLRHAEIIALEAAGGDARGATLYVNLEPCCHTGRTPPCTRAHHRRRRQARSRRHGRPQSRRRRTRLPPTARRGRWKSSWSSMQEKSRRLNEAFAMWITTNGLPFVTLKSAHDPRRPTGPARNQGRPKSPLDHLEASRAEVQRMRHASDALLTGIGTVLADDPLSSPTAPACRAAAAASRGAGLALAPQPAQ